MTEEQKQKYIKEANAAIFAGKPVSDMNRDELLVMIGWLGSNQEKLQVLRSDLS